MNYGIILKFSYTVEDVNSEEEAYEEAIKIMKQDTHPMPYDWVSYRLLSDEEEDQGASPGAHAICTKIKRNICAILPIDFFYKCAIIIIVKERRCKKCFVVQKKQS